MAIEPVQVVPYNPHWPRLFEAERVESALGAGAVAVEHVGSTAIPGLDAKPVVDLLVGLGSRRDGERCVRPLAGIGYKHRGEAGTRAGSSFARFAREGAPITCT